MQFSSSTAEAVLEEIQRCLKSAVGLNAPAEEASANKPSGLGSEVLLGQFGLHTLAAAITGLEPGSSRRAILRSFLWELVCPGGELQDKAA